MPLTSFNFAVNDYCNHKCQMCNIWENPVVNGISTSELRVALACNGAAIADVRELSLTGGEPFLRNDLAEIVTIFSQCMPRLEKVFINTNGSLPRRVPTFIERVRQLVPALYISVSLDGNETRHNAVRGVAAYTRALETLEQVRRMNAPNVFPLISTTLLDGAQALDVLAHVRDIANKIDCDFTFRVADTSVTYYRNTSLGEIVVSAQDIDELESFIREHRAHDEFLPHLMEFLRTGSNQIMIGTDGRNLCKAGDAFLFMEHDGTVRPCIYSTREIGNIRGAVELGPIADLGTHEKCPCCTECSIYPMLADRRASKTVAASTQEGRLAAKSNS